MQLELTAHPTSDDAAALLGQARDVLERPDAVGTGLWSRTAALLARQALEIAITRFWLFRVPAMTECTVRAQLLALSHYTDSEEMAPRVSYTWRVLTRACHHRAYELAPTETELSRWLDSVAWFVEASRRKG